ncbi:MAG: helix-turn-helix domain-containing protein [Pyrinomonadaceae bacterium]
MNGFISTKEAAAKLNVSVRRVQALIAAGRLPAEKIGNSFAIREADLKPLNRRKNGRPQNGIKTEEKDWDAIIKKFAGSITGGPSDLSTNKKYMEGYGRKPYMKRNGGI